MATITVNDQQLDVDAAPETPLLWVLRDHLGMTGTKYGCGMALCGACTVHVDGVAVRSCVLPLQAVEGKSITTIEGLSTDRSHAVQRAWIELDVPQCGYCQSGQIMSAAALAADQPGTERCRHRRRAWPATSAAAAPIRAFARRSIAPRSCCAGDASRA